MKNLLNNIINNDENLEKINFNLVLREKKSLYIFLSNEPIEMISEIENTYNLYRIFENVYYLIDKYYYDFVANMKKEQNQHILPDDADLKGNRYSVFLNFNSSHNIEKELMTFNESIFFDINNAGNIIIKPSAENSNQLLNVFYEFLSKRIEKTSFQMKKVAKTEKRDNKKVLIFDIQNSANEKSVEVLLKNLQQYEKAELYLIWRTGSIDFDYSHIDVENFWNYYQAIIQADIFLTDDKDMLPLLNKLKCDIVFLGKKSDSELISFNPKNIFDIKNFISSKLDE